MFNKQLHLDNLYRVLSVKLNKKLNIHWYVITGVGIIIRY